MEKITPLNNVNYLVQTRHGLFIANKQDFYLGNALISYGEYGEIEWNLLSQYLDSGSTVVEVGANIGTHTVSISRTVGTKGRVIAVEPQRVIFQYLCANLALNGLTNVETYHCGCGSESGALIVPPMDYSAEVPQNFGGVSLQVNGPGETVQIRRLDDLVGNKCGVQLIKIDVEGMEADVIKGATATILASRPILYVENDRVEKSEELIRLLLGLEYRLYWHITPLFNPDNFFGEKENIYGDVASINMLCFPNESATRVEGLQEIADPSHHPLRMTDDLFNKEVGAALEHGQCSAETWKDIGNTMLSLGRLDDAERAYRQALALNQEFAEAYNNLGNVLRLGTRLEEAELAFQKALELMPDRAEVHNNFGNVLMDYGRIDEAEQAFRKAIVLKSDFAMAYNNRGNALQALGRLDVAQKSHRQALILKPDYVEAYIGLGQDLMLSGRLDEAEQTFRHALTLKPDYVEAYIGLGKFLEYSERFDESEQIYRHTINLKPDHSGAYNGLGIVLERSGRLDEAEQAFLQALTLKPDYAIAKYCISRLYLLQGRLLEGFALYEQRFRVQSFIPNCIRTYSHQLLEGKRWEGGPCTGHSLLIIAEQGAGDQLMMMRYLPLLKQQGASSLIIYCEPQMMRLFKSISFVDEVVCSTEPLPVGRTDFYCFIMSLPYLFQTHLESIPDEAPLLFVPDKIKKKWHNHLKDAFGMKVGLVWAGSKGHAYDNKRSIPLSTFSPLLDIKGVQLISLQKGEDAVQWKALGWSLHDWMDLCNDYLDTAALVSGLDLVISVDTSVAHLAGVLGKPVWLLNRFESEWRWMLNRSDSPWYPSMIIFRQTEMGNWDSVISRVAKELSKLINSP